MQAGALENNDQEGLRVAVEQRYGLPEDTGGPVAATAAVADAHAGMTGESRADGTPMGSRPLDLRPEEPAPFVGGFAALGLSAATLAALEKAGYTQPTPVQAGLIPRALTGADVMGQARTGTGKTAAFVLPILERVSQPHSGSGTRALVLVPTRELAVQVRDEFEKLAQGSRIHCVAVYGDGRCRRPCLSRRACGPRASPTASPDRHSRRANTWVGRDRARRSRDRFSPE